MDMFDAYEELQAFKRARLQVLPEHLLERLSVQQIEKREQVSDPLGAAPELPFGHLNPTWTAFLQSTQSGDELWSFTARFADYSREQHSGYVIVRAGVPGAFFSSVLRYIEDPFPNPLLRLTPPD
jgi:hypothetical protein